jgi:tetratricopeptide (TPR) repeat protein
MLKYQEKHVEVNINNYHKTNKEHLVYYIMRDHFSGSFVFRFATTKTLIPLADFLYYSWSKREDEQYLRGMPDAVYVPQLISSPELFEGLVKLGIKPLNPPSGFASGIRIIRDIEDHIHYVFSRIVDHRPENLDQNKNLIYKYILRLNYDDSKFKKWQDNLVLNHPKNTPDYPDFIKCFAANADTGPGLLPANLSSGEEAGGLKQTAAKATKNKPGTVKELKFSAEKLGRAQELIYDAWETDSRQKRLDLARQALKISPYCADAYVLLARESQNLQESLEMYEKGVLAGKTALGDLFFRKNAGSFWGILETRPYMRALAGLAGCLWEKGEKREAIGHYREMLRLNPDDNQGIRYILISYLLEEGMDEEAGKLLAEHIDDPSCFMLYNRALWSFRTTGGGNGKPDSYLKEALESNIHVSRYLLGEKHKPYRLPDYYSFGSEEEAVIYIDEAKKAWQNTAGALKWLAGHFQKYQQPAKI